MPRFVNLKAEVTHHFVVYTTYTVKIPSITRCFTGHAVVIGDDDVVMKVAALTVGMRRHYHIRVRRDTAREFLTGEMCELNIEGVIFVQFIGMEILENMLRLIFTSRVPSNLSNSISDELHRRSVRCRADDRVRRRAHIVVAHVLVRAVHRVHSRSADTFRSMNFHYRHVSLTRFSSKRNSSFTHASAISISKGSGS